ncbi:response regulator [uncultured Rhodospira sp.]|uniref:response regulator n=1 Tax=uncultured Rhodospira sp. TaxID=1936189 RepID=UPI00260EEE62|nr:response regulator [uncultured Rhodospira sp.]
MSDQSLMDEAGLVLTRNEARTDALAVAALEAVPQALVVSDPQGRPVLVNRRARTLLRLPDEAAVRAWPGRMPGVAGGRGGDWDTLPLGDGTTAPFWFWSRPLPGDGGAGGTVLHALWPCRVSEEQAHASGADEAGFDEMMAVLARHALLGEMGGALAHQMSQPLNIIRLTAERASLEAEAVGAANTGGDGAAAERFARLADQAEALFETVSLVQGAPAVYGASDLEPVDLGSVLNRAAQLARSPLRAAGLKAEVITPPDMPPAWGEPVLLMQIVFAVMTVLAETLGGDAPQTTATRRFPAPAALVVRVNPEAASEAGTGRLCVDMTGDESVRWDIPLIAVAPDLTLSRRVVLAALALAGLGGHLMMLVDDQGALRGVRLDLARAGGRRPDDPDDSAARQDGDGADPADRRVRVLVAEDEAEAAAEIAEFLSDQGYGVTVAGDVASAVRALDTAAHDVLITDLSMPGGGARTLLRAALAAHPDMAVVLASGFAVEGDETLADVAEMADAILRKPLGLSELRDTITRVLAG